MSGCGLEQWPDAIGTTREPIHYNETFRTSYRDMLEREQRVQHDAGWP